MYRKIIKDQLEKVSFADLSSYNKDTNTFTIPKYSKPAFDLQQCYIIQVPATILNDTTSALATNWNFGTAPKYEYLKIYVVNKMGGMINVSSFGYDMANEADIPFTWNGWLPANEIKQIRKV